MADYGKIAEGISHIAFIMDGNGRWAKKRALPRSAGHSAGADNFKKVVENGKAKVVVSLEMSAGQMIEDVKLALDCKLPVELCNRMGGNVPSCAEVCEAIKRIYKEYTK